MGGCICETTTVEHYYTSHTLAHLLSQLFSTPPAHPYRSAKLAFQSVCQKGNEIKHLEGAGAGAGARKMVNRITYLTVTDK